MSDILIPNEQEAVMISGGQAAQDAIKILHERLCKRSYRGEVGLLRGAYSWEREAER